MLKVFDFIIGSGNCNLGYMATYLRFLLQGRALESDFFFFFFYNGIMNHSKATESYFLICLGFDSVCSEPPFSVVPASFRYPC